MEDGGSKPTSSAGTTPGAALNCSNPDRSGFLPSHLRDSRSDCDSDGCASEGSTRSSSSSRSRGKHKRKEKREYREKGRQSASKDVSPAHSDGGGGSRGHSRPARKPKGPGSKRGPKGGGRAGDAATAAALRDLDDQAAAMADLVKQLEREQAQEAAAAREAEEAQRKAAEEAALAQAAQLRREEIQEALRGVDVCWYDRPKVSTWDFLSAIVRHLASWSLLIAVVTIFVGLPSYDLVGLFVAVKGIAWWLTRGTAVSLAFAALFDLVEVHRGNSSRWWVVKHQYTFHAGAEGWAMPVPTTDTRTDQSSVGEGKHHDPLLCWFNIRRYVYVGGFHWWPRTTRVLISGELLMQLLDGSNMRLSSTVETAGGRLEDVASRSQAVILDKKDPLGGKEYQIKSATATVAYGFWESMREHMKHVPFPRSPSRQ